MGQDILLKDFTSHLENVFMPNKNQEDVELDIKSSNKERNFSKLPVKQVAKKI